MLSLPEMRLREWRRGWRTRVAYTVQSRTGFVGSPGSIVVELLTVRVHCLPFKLPGSQPL